MTINSIALSWVNPNDADLAEIVVRRATGDTAPTTPTAGSGVSLASASATTVTDTGLAAATQYSYAVFAKDSSGNVSTRATISVRTATPPDVTPPGKVTGLTTGTTTDSSIALSWTNPTDPDLAEIIVRRAVGTVAPVLAIDGTGVTLASSTANSVTDTGLTASTTYSYAVFTKDTNGNISGAATVTKTTQAPPDTTPPAAPSGLKVTSGDKQVVLTWAANTEPDIKDYLVYQGTTATGPWNQVSGSPATGTQIAVTGLTNSTSYWFTIAARDTGNNTSPKTTAVSAVPAPDSTPPGPITALTVGTRTSSSIDLSWTNPTDADLTTILVRRAAGTTPPTGPSDGAAVTLASATATAMHDTELTIASHYSYAVFARDASGNTSTAVIMTTGTRDSGADVCATPLTRDTTWSSDYRDTYTIHCTLSVPSGVKLTITAGTVVKFSQGSGLSLRSGGSLIGAGSETSPVVFTSWRDDSVGGDTNNDGGATTAKAGDWGQIAAERGATLDLSQVQVSFGDLVSGSSATVSVRNSLVSDNRHGGLQVSGSSNSDPPPVIQGNQFLRNGGPETACSTVSDLDPAVVVDFGYQGRLDLGQITGNTGTGNGYDAVFVSGRLGAGEQIWPSNGLAMVVGDDPGWYCNPDRQYSNGSLIVPSGTTLRMPAGSVAKFANMYTGAGSVVVESGGSLIGAGSETSPVVFTSWRDDSVGGDTNNDGGATTAKAGDWGQIAAERGATLDLSQVHLSWGSGLSLEWTSGESTARFEAIDLRHQTQGITVGDGWKVTIRGSISDVPGRYVHACNWSQKCAVDATNVSWGTPSGPFPAGHPTLVCGAVAIDPWVGMPTDHKSYLFNVPNCDGSTTPDVPVESARQAFNQRMSAYQELCALSQDACEQVDRMQRCYAAALDLAKAGSTFPIPESVGDWTTEGGKATVEAGSIYLRQSSSVVVSAIGEVAPIASSILGVVGINLSLKNAYDSCH